jgi:predicted kinase
MKGRLGILKLKNKMSKKVIILRGLPASGKSTYARKLLDENPGAYKRLNKDELRVMLDNNHHTTHNEKFIEKVRDLMLIEALSDGKHVIVDDTNLGDRPVERIKNVVRKFNADHKQQVQVEIKEINVSLEECLERDKSRDKKVGDEVILRMHRQHILKDTAGVPKHDKKHPTYRTQDPSLPKAIICDLDGTLCLMNGRSPFDASRCDKDLPNIPVVNMVKNYHQLGYKIILASGREDTFKPQTLLWLEKYEVSYELLIMRKAGDFRKDAIIKKEIFANHIEGKYFVELVLDDRNQVVDLWRNDLQLPCFQVFYGDF